jgi:hypothetical protein
MKEYLAKIMYNTKTGQPMVCLKKKKMKLLLEKKAQYVKIREKDIF